MPNQTLTLTKAMFGSDETLVGLGKKRKGRFSSKLWNVLIILVLLVSVGASMGSFVVLLFNALNPIGFESMIIRLIVPAAGIMVFVFGIFYVMNVFYFSKDVENFLYLPVKAGSIMTAKFLVSLIYQYFMLVLIFIPMLLVYGYLDKAGILYYVYLLIVSLLVPVLPLVVASLIIMLIMRLGKGVRNKDRFNMFAGVLGLGVSLGFNFGIQRLVGSADNASAIISDLSELPVFRNLSMVFPSSYFGIEALINYGTLTGIMNILILLAITAVSMVVFYFAGNALYFKGVMGVQESTSARKKLSSGQMTKETVSKPLLVSYANKEIKLLLRTPVYFLNCMLISLIYPVFFLLPFFAGGADAAEVGEILRIVQDAPESTILLFMAAAGFVLGGLNIISGTAISREGKNFFFMKYIPVPYMTQIYAKILSAFYVESVAATVLFIMLYVLVKPSIILVLLSLILFVLASVFINQFAILFDILMPKLLWDSEQKAVKQNLNSLIEMFGSFIFGGALVYIGMSFNPPMLISFLVLLVLLSGLIILFHNILGSTAEKHFSTMS
jgi:ABC-2 type transport system permease protein